MSASLVLALLLAGLTCKLVESQSSLKCACERLLTLQAGLGTPVAASLRRLAGLELACVGLSLQHIMARTNNKHPAATHQTNQQPGSVASSETTSPK